MSALAPRRRAWLRDTALSAVNGAIGDRLRERNNGLAIEMGLRHGRRPLPVDRGALQAAHPQHTSRACVLIHGLGLSEIHWQPSGRRPHEVGFGERLAREAGFTPLYLRYNTGLHVSHNGRALADLLERLVDAWPVPLEEILLLGHSMGGLVARSAAHQAHARGDRWVRRMRRLVCLGSPHLGAPLEKGAHILARLLGIIPTEPTRILGDILDVRSAGIKDLRHGYVTDACWSGHDADTFLRNTRSEVPLVAGVQYGFVAASVAPDPHHPLAWLVGDVLVRVPSASGRGEAAFDRAPELERAVWCHFGRMSHFDLLVHPDVCAQVLRWSTCALPEENPC